MFWSLFFSLKVFTLLPRPNSKIIHSCDFYDIARENWRAEILCKSCFWSIPPLKGICLFLVEISKYKVYAYIYVQNNLEPFLGFTSIKNGTIFALRKSALFSINPFRETAKKCYFLNCSVIKAFPNFWTKRGVFFLANIVKNQ